MTIEAEVIEETTPIETPSTEEVTPVETPPVEGTQPAETPPTEEEPVVELDGEKFTATQIQDALKISKNQADFTSKNQEEAARLNTLARVIEDARQGLINRPVDTPSSVQTPQGKTFSIETAEQFRDSLLGDNPTEAIALLANFITESVGKHSSESEAKNAFITAHPDYLQVINSPEYKMFKAQNPLGAYLNDVNGFYEFKASTTGNATKDAETKGFKAGEEKALANLKAKANLKILNSGGGVTPPSKTQITPETSHGEVLNAATKALISGRSNQ